MREFISSQPHAIPVRSRFLATLSLGLAIGGIALLLVAFGPWFRVVPVCGVCPAGQTCANDCEAAYVPYFDLLFLGGAVLAGVSPIPGALAQRASRRESHPPDPLRPPLRFVGVVGGGVMLLGLILWALGPYPPYLDLSVVGYLVACASFGLSFRPSGEARGKPEPRPA